MLPSVEVGKAEVLSIEVVEDALVPADTVTEVLLSLCIVVDTPGIVDTGSTVVLSLEVVEDAPVPADTVTEVLVSL